MEWVVEGRIGIGMEAGRLKIMYEDGSGETCMRIGG